MPPIGTVKPLGTPVGTAANTDMLDVRRRAVMRDHRMRREECVIGEKLEIEISILLYVEGFFYCGRHSS